jgi:hypothetical protein
MFYSNRISIVLPLCNFKFGIGFNNYGLSRITDILNDIDLFWNAISVAVIVIFNKSKYPVFS